MEAITLPLPRLETCAFGALPVLTDPALATATGVCVAFASRAGGVSSGPYESLNLSTAVGDDPSHVFRNRALVAEALTGDAAFPFIIPKQVHGTRLVIVDDNALAAVALASQDAEAGADGVVVEVDGVGALLNFADCVPVIIVSPSGHFAVVHAGWRGVEASIAPLAARLMAERDQVDPSALNVYIGPYIHGECFETDADVHKRFVDKFGVECSVDEAHINLGKALKDDLSAVGLDVSRIADADICTVCASDRYFSFRAAAGVCGRHGALAFRKRV